MALPREARLPPGRLRLHHLHRQLRPAARRDLRGGQRERPHRRLGAVRQPQLRGPHQPRRQDELPRLAAAGGRLRPRRHDGLRLRDRAARQGHRRAPTCSSRDIWPAPADVERDMVERRSPRRCSAATTPTSSPATSAGGRCPRPRATPSTGTRSRPTCASPRTSRACSWSRRRSSDITGARVLAKLGDSVTTDHISPAGSIKPDSPAGKYLAEHGVDRKDFNSYGSRRGNHEVMIRGTFANIRLRNQLLDGVEGGFTRDFLAGGEQTTIYDASAAYAEAGMPLVVLAGKEYGSGSSRDWAAKGTRAARGQGRHRRVLRAHPPLQPDRHGRAAAAVPRGRERRVARPGRHRDVRRHRHHGAQRRQHPADGDGHRDRRGRRAGQSSSTPSSGSTPPARRTTTATAASCSTSCGRSSRAESGAPPPQEHRGYAARSPCGIPLLVGGHHVCRAVDGQLTLPRPG